MKVRFKSIIDANHPVLTKFWHSEDKFEIWNVKSSQKIISCRTSDL